MNTKQRDFGVQPYPPQPICSFNSLSIFVPFAPSISSHHHEHPAH